MRFAVALLALASAVASASASTISIFARQAYPDCAVPCLTNANYGGCSPTDDTCLCNSSVFIESSTTCIEESCTGTDLQEAEAAGQSLCASVGVYLTATSYSASYTGSVSASSSAPSSSSTSTSSTSGAVSNGVSILTGAAAFAVFAATL